MKLKVETLKKSAICFFVYSLLLGSVDLAAFGQPELFRGRMFTSLPGLLEDYSFVTQAIALEHLENIEALEKERLFLDSIGVSGTDYLFEIADAYVVEHPPLIEKNNLNTYAALAEGFQLKQTTMPDSIWVYDALFDLFATAGSQELQRALDAEEIDASDTKIVDLRRRYAELKYLVKVKVSNFSKAWRNLKEGNFPYLYHKATSTYKKEASGILVGGILFLIAAYWGGKKIRKARSSG